MIDLLIYGLGLKLGKRINLVEHGMLVSFIYCII